MKQEVMNSNAVTGLARRARSFAAAFLGGLVTVAPVWADDTEIFFGGTVAGVQPNVLFILDTSGSMRNTVAGTGKTRLENMQDAMEQLLTRLNGVNVGLMRFSNPGGPVLYAVSDIDANLSTTVDIVSVSASVQEGSDDAQQVIGGNEASFFQRRDDSSKSAAAFTRRRLQPTGHNQKTIFFQRLQIIIKSFDSVDVIFCQTVCA